MADEITGKALTVKLEAVYHERAKRIALRFPYDADLIKRAKEAGARWSQTHKCWHVADGSASLKAVYAQFKGHAWVDGSACSRSLSTGTLRALRGHPTWQNGRSRVPHNRSWWRLPS